jgi:hypothetical protein
MVNNGEAGLKAVRVGALEQGERQLAIHSLSKLLFPIKRKPELLGRHLRENLIHKIIDLLLLNSVDLNSSVKVIEQLGRDCQH